jgi:hypothetical protein
MEVHWAYFDFATLSVTRFYTKDALIFFLRAGIVVIGTFDCDSRLL